MAVKLESVNVPCVACPLDRDTVCVAHCATSCKYFIDYNEGYVVCGYYGK